MRESRAAGPGFEGALPRALPAILRELRRQKGISQPALAQSVGMTKARVSRLERGAARLSAIELVRLADELGVSVDYLAHGMRPRKPPDDRLRAKILEAEQELPDALRSLLVEAVETMLRMHARIGELVAARLQVDAVRRIRRKD